jgi:hypothetical protein
MYEQQRGITDPSAKTAKQGTATTTKRKRTVSRKKATKKR